VRRWGLRVHCEATEASLDKSDLGAGQAEAVHLRGKWQKVSEVDDGNAPRREVQRTCCGIMIKLTSSGSLGRDVGLYAPGPTVSCVALVKMGKAGVLCTIAASCDVKEKVRACSVCMHWMHLRTDERRLARDCMAEHLKLELATAALTENCSSRRELAVCHIAQIVRGKEAK
jgi:hypothetical protein